MTTTVEKFIERVDCLEARYAKDKYADRWLMPREMMLALRDELKAQECLPSDVARKIHGAIQNSLASGGGEG